MEDYFYPKLRKIHLELETIDMDSCDILVEVSESMIRYLEKEMTEIRAYFLSLKSISEKNKITFSKRLNPIFCFFAVFQQNKQS